MVKAKGEKDDDKIETITEIHFYLHRRTEIEYVLSVFVKYQVY